MTYTPSADFPGSDSFAFTVSNGYATSAPASVTITQDPVPQAIASTVVMTPENGFTYVDLQGASSAGNPLTYEVTSQPADGTLSGSDGSLIYTPNSGFTGLDSFQFVVNDGYQISAPGTETVIVYSPAAVSPAQTLIAYENQPTSFTLGGSNQSSAFTTVEIAIQPGGGNARDRKRGNRDLHPDSRIHGHGLFRVRTCQRRRLQRAANAVGRRPCLTDGA